MAGPINTAVTHEPPTTIFVTGGTGLLGSHLIRKLARSGCTIKALYHHTTPAQSIAGNVEWIKGDVLDIQLLEDVLKDVDLVYHCAAIVSFLPKKAAAMLKINVEGTKNLINGCLDAEVKKLCHVSSVAALGLSRNGAEVDESCVWDDKVKSNYAKSKYLSEMEVWRGVGEGLNAVVVNPSVILGPGNWNTGSSKIFKTAYEEFPWYSEGVTGFVDVADVVEIMIRLMETDVSAEKFVVNGENLSYQQLFTMIATAFGKKPPHKRVTPMLAGIVRRLEGLKAMFGDKDPLLTKETAEAALTRVTYNNSKLLDFLGGFSYTPIDVTVKRVCEELRQQYSLS